MRPATASNVEAHLYDAGGWLSSRYLEDFWHLSERGVRRMLAGVAVGGEKGFIHTYHATQDEVDAYCGPKQGHAVTELKNIKRLRLNHRHRRRPPHAHRAELAMAIQPELLP